MSSFRHVTDWGQTRFSDELSVNIVQFLNQAYLNIGAFQNISISDSGAYGGDLSLLKPVNDPRYEEGQVWQGFRKNWVYETINYSSNPTYVSGVYVDGVFQPTTGVGTYSHVINYRDGCIIFDSGISITGVVRAEYSYKLVHIDDDRSTWFKEFQYNSLRADHEHFNQYGSGIWNTLPQDRVQLPAIVCQPLSDIRLVGSALGGHNDREQSIILNVFAENSWDKRAIADDLINQKDAKIFLFDYNKVLQSGVYPLLYDGTLNPSGWDYDEIIAPDTAFRRRYTFVENVTAEDLGETRPYHVIVRWFLKVYI